MKAKIGDFIIIHSTNFPWVNPKTPYQVIGIDNDLPDDNLGNATGTGKDPALIVKGVDKMVNPIERPFFFNSDDDYEVVEGD